MPVLGPTDNTPVVSIDNLTDFNTIYGAAYTGHDYEFNAPNSTTIPANWSWQNQGTSAYRERFGAGTIHSIQTSSWRSIVQSVTGLPSTYDAFAKVTMSGAKVSGGFEWGLLLTDGTNHRVFERVITNTGDQHRTAQWASASSFTSVSNAVDVGHASGPMYFWVHKNSATSYDYKASNDGLSWYTVATAYNPGITVTHIGIAALGPANQEVSCHWFRVR